MRVLVLGSYADSIINFRGQLISDLVTRGAEVFAAAPNLTQSHWVSRIERLGARARDVYLQRSGMNPVKDIVSLWSIWRLLREVKPDIILCYTIKPVLYGAIAARLLGIKLVFPLITGLGYAFQDKPGFRARLLKKIVFLLYKVAMKNAHVVFFQNTDDKEVFISNGLLGKGQKVVVVPGSGVDIRHFEYSVTPINPFRFLMVARLLKSKGVMEYLEAARKLKKEFPAVQFDLVGWVDDGPDSIDGQEIEQLKHEGVINFLGRLEDVRPALRAASVYVLPSYREGMPRSVLEAMAIGRAIITTNAPGCRDTVQQMVNGLLVSPRSAVELCNAMRHLINRQDLVVAMGEESRTMAETTFDVNITNQLMLETMGL